VAIIGGGSGVTYQPKPNFHGIDSFMYTITDGEGGTDEALVTVTVTPVNDPPVAVDDGTPTPIAVLVNTSRDIDVVANDLDVDGDTLIPVSVSDPRNGTATLNSNGTITYQPDDNFVGQDTFTYQASDGTDTSSDPATVTITVAPLPTITIGNVDQREGTSLTGTTPFVFTLTLSAPSVLSVTVDVFTVGGTAEAGKDFTPIGPVPVTFSPGQVEQTVTVLVEQDDQLEGFPGSASLAFENFLVKLTAAKQATIEDDIGIGTILDDDFRSLSINGVLLREGTSPAGTTAFDFTVTLSSPTIVSEVTVDVFTEDGTAEAGVDYQPIPRDPRTRVTFGPGETTKTVTVLITPDTRVEGDEEFFVSLGNVTNATADDTGLGTILDDDDADADGVGDDIENQVPNPVGGGFGDGNGDGTQDSEQPNVTSSRNAVDGRYVTLVSPPGTTLKNVDAIEDPPAGLPPGTILPFGLFGFTVGGITPGGSTKVEMLLPDGEELNGYIKVNQESSDLDPLTFNFVLGFLLLDPTVGAEFFDTNGDGFTDKIILHLKDGGPGDFDGQPNGIIVDPGGPAFTAPSTGSVTGVKFHDLNFDGVRDAGEPGLEGWTIFLDVNGNRILEEGEPRTVTDADGVYALTGIIPGRYRVDELIQPGWRAAIDSCFDVEVVAGQTATQDFANFLAAEIRGAKFHDLNGNGLQEAGEPGLADWTIFADLNGDHLLDLATEPFDLTDAEGRYALVNLFPGAYQVRELLQPGWLQTAPAAGFHPVTVGEGEIVAGRDFGNLRNVRPVANPDVYAVDEGGTLTKHDGPGAATPGDPSDDGVLANDQDADNEAPTPANAGLTAELVAGPANAAAFTFNRDGGFSYTHDGSETTSDRFRYRVFDGFEFSDPTEVSLTINPVNDLPAIVSAPPATAVAGVRYVYDVEATDPDPGEALAFSLRAFPVGMGIDAATGLIQWTPTAAQIGAHPVTVRVTDRAGAFTEQTFTIAVAAPVFNGDLDGDGDRDQDDLRVILAARNTRACGPNDFRDLDRDGRITALDARAWVARFLT
jgi:hypothetical protein